MAEVAERKKSRGLSSQRRGQIGVNVVERIVLHGWSSRWQPLDAHNDDGVDGLVFLESNGEATGQVVYVQVKCRTVAMRKGVFSVSLGRKRWEKAIRRWRRLIGAAILVLVDPVTLEARWVDLMAAGDAGSGKIVVPETQFFDASARRQIANLCGTLHRDVTARKVKAVATDFMHLRSKDPIRVAARALYKDLASAPLTIGQTGQHVRFTREGWRHITRRGRPELTRFQSYVLLGSVRAILAAMGNDDIIRLPTSRDVPSEEEYYVLKAAVTFPHRQSGIVKMVLHRNSADPSGTYRFHTIYEPRRRRSLTGTR